MKVKKSDFVRICKAMEMEPGECGVLLETPSTSNLYVGQIVVCPWKKITDDTAQKIISWSGTHSWSNPPYNVGILPVPIDVKIEVEDD